jgi:phosphoenolpyruvate-protein phosphotransferase
VVVASEGFAIPWRAAAGDTLQAGSPLMDVVRQGAAPTAAASIEQEWTATAVVGHADGIHARPAALVQAAARAFAGEITVELGGRTASAKSIVALMSLGARHKERLMLRARGAGAQAAVARVVAALEATTRTEHREPAGDAPGPPPDAGPGLRGVCAAPGLATGRVVRLDSFTPEPPEGSGDVEVERNRRAAAVARARDDIARAMSEAQARGVPQQHAILATHHALVDDPEISLTAQRAIGGGESAGHAFRRAVRAQCDVLAGLGNPLLAERAADLREIERRVLGAMTGDSAAAPDLFDGSILISDDIGVAELSRLPRERVAGLCTVRGGATSHVAILARALGVPALVAVGPALLRVPHGKEVVLDATAELLDPEPDAARLAATADAIRRRTRDREDALAQTRAPAITRDGRTVEVAANVAGDDDVKVAIAHGADGVGLMRTELLFVDRRDEPTEEEQRRAYQSVVDALGGRAAIIRTLDAGGDKPLPFLPMPREENPALGLRGIRSGLVRPRVLDRQLRALLAVQPLSACRVMLPMVTDAAELLSVRGRIDALAAEMGIAERPQLGVMVEVPSAALLADQLAEHADFLSIGTNDLTQYALAMDRGNAELAARLDGLHPAVLRLIARTVQGASTRGKWVGVCGAMASDLEAVPVLVGLGVTELSVSPPLVPEVKARVRLLDYAACKREALALLDETSAGAVRERARRLWPAGNR